MGKCLEHAGFRRLQQRGEAGLCIRAQAQHKRIDENADHILQVWMGSACNRKAQAHILLALAAQQQRYQGAGGHEGRGAGGARHAMQRIALYKPEIGEVDGTRRIRRRWAGMVGDQGGGW